MEMLEHLAKKPISEPPRAVVIFANLLLAAFVTVISFAVGEFVLRQLYPSEMVADPLLGHRARPDIYDHDGRGFRNPAVLDQADIVAIGDSQTEGNNATSTETWPYQLGRALGVDAYDLGVAGYGPIHYSAMLEDALALHPKYVAVGFYLGNDLSDAYALAYGNEYWKAWRDPGFVGTQETDASSADAVRLSISHGLQSGTLAFNILEARTWLRDHSVMYAMLGNATFRIRVKLHLAPSVSDIQSRVDKLAAAQPGLSTEFTRDPISTVLSAKYRYETVNLDNPETREGWRITRRAFEEMRATVEGANAKFILVVIPTKEMAYLTFLEATEHQIPGEFVGYFEKERQVLRDIETFCAERSLTCVHVLDDLADALAGGIPVYPNGLDGHPVPEGYRVIADSVARQMREHFPEESTASSRP